MKWLVLPALTLCLGFVSCSQESQNRFSRGMQNWTGVNGVLEVYAGDKVVRRFLEVDKLTTATATEGGSEYRPYRFGYGILDKNLNEQKDPGEKRV